MERTNEPIAYKSGEVMETLKDHLVSVGRNTYRYFLSNGAHEYIARRILLSIEDRFNRYLKEKISLEDFSKIVHDAILLSSTFHDLGKAFNEYQRRALIEEKVSFSGHEGISSALLWPVMKDLFYNYLLSENIRVKTILGSASEDLAFIFLRGVFWHHHTMVGREKKSEGMFNDVLVEITQNKRKTGELIVSWPEIVTEVLEEMKELFETEKIVGEILELTSSDSYEEKIADLIRVRNEILSPWDLVKNRVIQRKTSINLSKILVYIISVSDNMAAIESRGQESKKEDKKSTWEVELFVIKQREEFRKKLLGALANDHR